MIGRALLIGEGTARSSARSMSVIAAALGLFGVLVIASVGDAAMNPGAEPYAKAKRQAVFLIAGVAAALLVRAADYRALLRSANWLLVGTWALLVALLLAPVKEQLGAKRWFELPGLGHFQPSELAKIVLVIWCGAFAAKRGPRIREFRAGGLPGFLVVAVTAGLVLLQKDLGTTLLLGVIGATALVVSGARIAHLAPPIACGAPLLVIVMSSKFDYVKERLNIFKQGFHESNGLGQVDQALRALGSGGWFGRGFGDSRAHLGYVPQVHNDFVLAAVGEQLGFVGSAAVVVLIALFFLHGARIAAAAKDRFGFTLAYGCAFLVALQAAVNLAVSTAMVPPKGINLPFVSYGGSSIVLLGVLVGLIASVARVAEAETIREEAERRAAEEAASLEASTADDETAESALVRPPPRVRRVAAAGAAA